MRIRHVNPARLQDERFGGLSMPAKAIMLALPCAADREGRLQDRPAVIAATLFPYDRIDPEDMRAALDELERARLVARYTTDEPLLQICTFADDQRPHPRERQSSLGEPKANLGTPKAEQGEPKAGNSRPVIPVSPVISGTTPRKPPGGGQRKTIATDTERELAHFHASQVRLWKADAACRPESASTLRGFHGLVSIDRRSPERVRDVLGWLFTSYEPTGDFDWRPNVLSGAKVRKHWDRLDAAYTRWQHPAPRARSKAEATQDAFDQVLKEIDQARLKP